MGACGSKPATDEGETVALKVEDRAEAAPAKEDSVDAKVEQEAAAEAAASAAAAKAEADAAYASAAAAEQAKAADLSRANTETGFPKLGSGPYVANGAGGSGTAWLSGAAPSAAHTEAAKAASAAAFAAAETMKMQDAARAVEREAQAVADKAQAKAEEEAHARPEEDNLARVNTESGFPAMPAADEPAEAAVPADEPVTVAGPDGASGTAWLSGAAPGFEHAAAAKAASDAAFAAAAVMKEEDAARAVERAAQAVADAAQAKAEEEAHALVDQDNLARVNTESGFPAMPAADEPFKPEEVLGTEEEFLAGEGDMPDFAAEAAAIAPVETGEKDGALYDAAEEGDEERVAELLAKGVGPNAAGEKNEDCETPLHMAAGAGHAAVVQLLLGAGADKAAANEAGETALDHAEDDEVKELLA